jgi:thymidylate synthase (FAD)
MEFQEFSQRYSSVTNVQEIEIRKQAEKNRQSSAESFNPTLSESKITNYKKSGQIKASEAIGDFLEASMRLYSELIDAGVAREVARDILPLATETTMYMKGSLRSWIHYLELRTGDDTQKEHRDIANQIKHIFIENFPNIGEALNFKN